MDENLPNEDTVPSVHSKKTKFVRELEERLFTGCSVTYTVPQQAGQINIADQVLRGLQERGCLTAYIDLDLVSSMEALAYTLLWKYLRLCRGGHWFIGRQYWRFTCEVFQARCAGENP